MTTTAPQFDHTQVAILIKEMRTYVLSLPIVKDIITNPGSECSDWVPLLDVRGEKFTAFRRRMKKLGAAYGAMGINGRTSDDRDLMLNLLEQFQTLMEGMLDLFNAHSKRLPLSEQYAGELEEVVRPKVDRMLKSIRESI